MASQEDESQQQSAPTDLFGSLKIVSEAAQSTFNKQSNKVDTSEVAGAASNLLGAASQYGNLNDQQGLGKYVDQAQGYLQKYHQSGGSPQAATADPTQTKSPTDDVAEPKRRDDAGAEDDSSEQKKPDATADDDGEGDEPRKVATDEGVDTEPKKDDQEEGGGGFGSAGAGDYAKIAQGFLGKSAGEDDAETKGTEKEGGVGDYVKIAQGFIGKSAKEDEGEEKGNKEEGGGGVGNYVKIAKGLFG